MDNKGVETCDISDYKCVNSVRNAQLVISKNCHFLTQIISFPSICQRWEPYRVMYYWGDFSFFFLKEEKKKICIGRGISLNFVELMLKLFDRKIISIAQVKIFAERGTKIFSMPQQNWHIYIGRTNNLKIPLFCKWYSNDHRKL